jgi:hypothetical protein
LRLLVLHARGRAAGPVACGLGAVAVACWALVVLMRDTGTLVTVLGPLAAMSLLGLALGAADPALERVMPKRWPRWRVAELAVCALASVLALLPALVHSNDQITELLRNVAGLGGLAALGVVALGARLAWAVPAAYALAGAALGPRDEDWLAPLTWPVQEDHTGVEFATALAVAGACFHVRHGARAA